MPLERFRLSLQAAHQVVVHDQTKQAVKQSQVDLLEDLGELRLHHDVALALARLPHLVQVVDALAPLVGEQRRRFRVGRFDPRGEQTPLVGLEVEELVEVRVGDLLHRLDVVARDELVVGVEELDAGLLERALREQKTLDARKRLVRVVVGLLDQGELLALRLVQATLDAVRLLELLEGEDEELGVVLVRQGRERDRGELARFEPVDGGGVDRDGFLRGDVRLRMSRNG